MLKLEKECRCMAHKGWVSRGFLWGVAEDVGVHRSEDVGVRRGVIHLVMVPWSGPDSAECGFSTECRTGFHIRGQFKTSKDVRRYADRNDLAVCTICQHAHDRHLRDAKFYAHCQWCSNLFGVAYTKVSNTKVLALCVSCRARLPRVPDPSNPVENVLKERPPQARTVHLTGDYGGQTELTLRNGMPFLRRGGDDE